jgi:hypothetical protein
MIVQWRFAFALSAILVSLPKGSATAIDTRPFFESQTLRIANPSPADDFGYSLDATYERLIAGAINVNDALGADVGAAYIYRRGADAKRLEEAVEMPVEGADIAETTIGFESANVSSPE